MARKRETSGIGGEMLRAAPDTEWHAARLVGGGPQAFTTPAPFEELAGANNPFAAVDVGIFSLPAFVDIDADGDLDLVVGNNYGALAVFRRNGDGSYTALSDAENPLFGLDDNDYFATPAAIDLDADNDLDLAVGTSFGDIVNFTNMGGGVWSRTGSLPGIDVGSNSTPTAVDVDGDGDLDLVVGEDSTNLNFVRNNGGGNFALVTGPDNPFTGLDAGVFSAPSFVDLDNDGDMDLVVGGKSAALRVFENVAGTFTLVTEHPLDDFTFGTYTSFTFVDLDGDGDRDGVAGSQDGQIRVFRNLSVGACGPLSGTSDADVLTGGPCGQEINGLGGDDDLDGLGGGDTIYGGSGNDMVDGGSDADTLYGGEGNDSLFADSAGDVVLEAAGEGADRIYATVDYTLYTGQEIEILSTTNDAGTSPIALGGNDLANTIYGNAGANILYGKGGADYLYGFGGNDVYFVESAGDQVIEGAGGGNDRIYASADYTLYAGQHVETLSTDNNAGTAAINLGGNELANTIYGNAGTNILYGLGGNDYLAGLGGDDQYYIDSAGDFVAEGVGAGNDRIFAGDDYTLYTGQQIEILSTDNNAGTTAIALGGNDLDNTIYGNEGNNILYGKGGSDTLLGLGGNDQFWFTDALGATNVDTIYGFASGADKLVLFQSVFTALTPGSLSASAFVTGTAAGDADDRIIYNSATGALLYDADGNGAGAAVQFATLNGAPVINAGDFITF